MKTTKLGISVGFMGAILCGLGLFGGYFLTIAAVAYVLIREENMWLRKTAIKVLVLTFAFPLLHTIIGFLPDTVKFINDVMYLFDDYFKVEKLSEIVTVLKDIVNIAEYVVFILLGILAFSQRTIRLPLVDKIIDKHTEKTASEPCNE
jgi:uncharacterized membrane protein